MRACGSYLRSARAHGVKPIKDFDNFLDEVGDVWPPDEDVDEFYRLVSCGPENWQI